MFFTPLSLKQCLQTMLMLGLLFCSAPTYAGYIEDVVDENGNAVKTVIHVTLHDWIFQELDPARSGTPNQANAAAMHAFSKSFPQLFQDKIKQQCVDNPERYGQHNWDHVEIRLEQFSGIEVEGIESDLLAIAGGVAPDIMYLAFRKSDTYIQEGFLAPLDDPQNNYISRMTQEELAFRVNPKIWPVIQRKGPNQQQHIWALPHGGAIGKVLLYRKDLFNEAGIPFPDKNWTWQDLYAAAKKLTTPATGRYGISLPNVNEESYNWITFCWSAGSEVLIHDKETDDFRIAFDNPKAAKALDFYTRLCTEPWKTSNGRTHHGYAFREANRFIRFAEWTKGNIGMALGSIDETMFARSIDPELTGMAPVPLSDAGIRASELNSRMMGLYSDIPHPLIQDAAWEFIRYYGSKEAMAIKTRIMVEGGLAQFVHPKFLRLFGYEALIKLAPPEWEETFNIAIDSSKPEPYGKHSTFIYNVLDGPVKKANELGLAGELPDDREAREAVLLGLLEKGAQKARRDILGTVPVEEVKKRNSTALAFLILITGVLAFSVRYVFTLYKTAAKVDNPPSIFKELKGNKPALILLLPALLTILFWQYLPLVKGSMMAFQDYKVLGDSSWVGLDNFGNVLWDKEWWTAVYNALRYSMLVIALTFLPPVFLAVLLQEIPSGKILFRTLFYLPAVISSLVAVLLWKSFYAPGESGILNRILLNIPSMVYLLFGLAVLGFSLHLASRFMRQEKTLGALLWLTAGILVLGATYGLAHPALTLPNLSLFARLMQPMPSALNWLQDPSTALIACVLPAAWASIGPGCLIYLAALKGVPEEMYEAADMDGASFSDKLFFIAFPILKPLLIINFIGVFIGSWFYAGGNILAMTAGQAGTEVAGLHIFYKAFVYLKFGPATAMAWILGVLLICFTVYQLRILSRLEFRTTGDD